MRILFNAPYTPNFKQIKLSDEEKEKSEKLFVQLKEADTPYRSIRVRKDIYDILIPHLENEVQDKMTDTTVPERNFGRNLFLKFHKGLDDVLNGNTEDFQSFIDELNKFSEAPENSMHTQLANQYILGVKRTRGNVYTLSKILGLYENQVIDMAHRCPNILSVKPEYIGKNLSDVPEVLNIDKEVYLKTAIVNTKLLLETPERINDNVTRSAELLGVGKDKFISRVKKAII